MIEGFLILRLTFVCTGLLIAVAIWPSLWPRSPGQWIAARLMRLAEKLNRANRSVAVRVWRGLLLVLFACLLAVSAGFVVSKSLTISPFMLLLECGLIAWLLPFRLMRAKVHAVRKALRRNEITEAKVMASALARRDLSSLDEAGLRRVSMEYLAENFADHIAAPIFWYLLLGLPGLFAVRIVNLLDQLIGHRNEEMLAFGWAAAKLDDALIWLPARLSGVFFCFAALFIPGGKPWLALRTMLGQARLTASPNAGWPLAAMAGALNVSLGGPRKQQGARIEDGWMGPGSARVSAADVRRALVLFSTAALLMWLSCALALAVLANVSII